MSFSSDGKTILCDGANCAATVSAPIALRPKPGTEGSSV